MINWIKIIWRVIIIQAKRIKLPFFEGLSLYDVLYFFLQGIVNGNISNRAGSIAYSFFLALFPGIIFLFTLIPYFQIDGMHDEIFEVLRNIMPPDTFHLAESTFLDILNIKRSGLLSFGFFFTLLFATNGVNSLLSNFTVSVHQEHVDRAYKQYLISILLTIVLSLLFLVGLVLIIFSGGVLNSLLTSMNLERISPTIIETVRIIIFILMIQLVIALLYNSGLRKMAKWRFLSPGSILATVLILLSSFGFSYYVSNFSQYNKVYGSIGTLIVILLWIYVNALVLIIGYELNVSFSSAIKSNKKTF